MKYIKKFNTEAEYLAYKNSENFITPNVTYVVANDGVHMTPDNSEIFEVADGAFETTDGYFKVLK